MPFRFSFQFLTPAPGNVMQALEDRTEKSRREMDLHDTIDTVRVLNARNQHIDIDKVLECTTSFCAHTFILSISRAAFDRRL